VGVSFLSPDLDFLGFFLGISAPDPVSSFDPPVIVSRVGGRFRGLEILFYTSQISRENKHKLTK
jgi:hypothetical protein